MGKKINNTTEFPSTTPATNDRVLGIDVSNTSNDANGETVTFTISSIRNGALVSGDNVSLLTNDAGYLTAVDIVSDTTPQLGGQLDVNGQAIGDGTRELVTFTEDASAVNHINIENEATGSGPIISAAGDDTNIDLNLVGKGTGNVKVGGFTFDGDQSVGAGQDNYVLTYDHSGGLIALEAAATGGSGGITPISKTTASASATVDISLTGGYARYRVHLYNVAPASDNVSLDMLVSDDSGSTFETTGYSFSSQNWLTSGSSAGAGGASTSEFNVVRNVGNATNEKTSGFLDIHIADGSNLTWVWGQGATLNNVGGFYGWGFTGLHEATTAITDIRFLFSSGNIATGEFHLFGYVDGDA